MTDPVALRADAARCRAAGASIETSAATIGSLVPDLLSAHPVAAVWRGPAATTFATVARSATTDTAAASRDAHDYAVALRRRATALDLEADAEERRRASTSTPAR